MSAAVARSRSQRSAQTATSRSRPAARSDSRRQSGGRPSLQVFDQVAIRNRARRRYVIIAGFVVLLAGLFAVALIQAQLVANQHRLDGLRSEIAVSEVEHTRLERMVEEASAPSAIIDQAMEMGMVRAIDPVYLAPSEPAVTVPMPISLGSLEEPMVNDPMTAAPNPADVDGRVTASPESVSTQVTTGETSGEAVSATAAAPAGVASLAGTTAVSHGVSRDQSTEATLSAEQALPAVTSVSVEETTDDSSSGPVWAGAVTGTPGVANE